MNQKRNHLSPSDVVEILREGNRRLLESRRLHRDVMGEIQSTSAGQHPIAAVLSCIDSRTPSELIFDQGLGDIFSIRIAGNVVNDDILGSLEFACKIAEARLILVLGHTQCGAIQGACANIQLGHLTALVRKIQPAIHNVSFQTQQHSTDVNPDLVALENVRQSIEQIKNRSLILSELLSSGSIAVVGGMYDVSNGKVEIFEQ